MDFLVERVTLGSRIRCGIRWVAGLLLIYFCAKSLMGIREGSFGGVFVSSLFAFAKGITGVILLVPDLAMFAARPLLNWIDSIYLPSATEDRPPLDYKLADYYRRTRRPDEAIDRYSEIVRHYPGEAKAMACLFLLLREVKKDREASRILRRGKRRFGREAFKQTVRSIQNRASGTDGG